MNLFRRALNRVRHGQYRGDIAVARLDHILTPAPHRTNREWAQITVLDVPAPLASAAPVPVMAENEEAALA